ncbi:MAG: hypothetical protein L0170_19435, partial [Acidobacteria bacterium]|nr:hypothetical protein [Acidobacteriota bacterium]
GCAPARTRMAKPKKPTTVTLAIAEHNSLGQVQGPTPVEIPASYQRAEDLICVHRKHGYANVWTATHVPTGMSAGDGFTTKRDAQEYARAALELPFPWAWGTFGSAQERPAGLREALLELRAKWSAIGV